MTDLTEQEKIALEIIRELRPFEVIEIHKDKLGKADAYLVKRSQKIMVTTQEIRHVKVKMEGF